MSEARRIFSRSKSAPRHDVVISESHLRAVDAAVRVLEIHNRPGLSEKSDNTIVESLRRQSGKDSTNKKTEEDRSGMSSRYKGKKCFLRLAYIAEKSCRNSC